MARLPSPASSSPAAQRGGPLAEVDRPAAQSPLATARSLRVSADDVFQWAARLAGLAILLTLVAIVALQLWDSRTALQRFGLSFFTSSTWDNVKQQFGILPYIYGTVMTSAVAMIIGVPIAIG